MMDWEEMFLMSRIKKQFMSKIYKELLRSTGKGRNHSSEWAKTKPNKKTAWTFLMGEMVPAH